METIPSCDSAAESIEKDPKSSMYIVSVRLLYTLSTYATVYIAWPEVLLCTMSKAIALQKYACFSISKRLWSTKPYSIIVHLV